MSKEYLVFHNVAHMAYHFSHGGLGLRPDIDLFLLRNITDYSEEKLKELLEACDIVRFYDYCCKLIDVWFKGSEHDVITKRMEQFCFQGGVFGNANNAMVAKMRMHSGISYYYNRLFVKRKNMEQVFPILKKKPYLLLLYQMKRWSKGLTSSRGRVKEEIRNMKNTDYRTMESFDALMKSVGL